MLGTIGTIEGLPLEETISIPYSRSRSTSGSRNQTLRGFHPLSSSIKVQA